jgi:hypothetical protein
LYTGDDESEDGEYSAEGRYNREGHGSASMVSTGGGGDDSKEAQGPMGVKEGVEDKKHKRNPSDGRHRVAPK